MTRVRAGEVQLGWREWGKGDVTVVFIHGNLASKDWIELASPFFPGGLRVIGIDWRGCGDSDRPPPTKDYANYSMQQHAQDMLSALDALQIPFCHLATHSTGGIIAARMMLMQPERFGRVFALDPVTPLGISFNTEQIGIFRSMMASGDVTHSVMASAAASLFAPESLAPNEVPRFREGLGNHGRSSASHWARGVIRSQRFSGLEEERRRATPGNRTRAARFIRVRARGLGDGAEGHSTAARGDSGSRSQFE